MATQYKPILFSTEMVQAILEGRKTQTRRIIKPQPIFFGRNDERIAVEFRKNIFEFYDVMRNDPFSILFSLKPKFQIGDILWVRETWQTTWNENKKSWDTIYKADGGYWIDDDGIMKWKPSIYMPKKRARIFLEVTNVRVERLRDISEEDAIAEGFGPVINDKYPAPGKFINHLNNHHMFNAIDSFASMWVKLNGKGAWKSNPWVWVYEFKQVHHPKDFLNEH